EKYSVSRIGARKWPTILRVPGDNVYNPSSVRSTRGAPRHWLLATTAATNTTASATRASAATRGLRSRPRTSVGSPQVEHQYAGRQPEHDAEDEIDHVTHVQHAACNGREMMQEAEVGNVMHQRCR